MRRAILSCCLIAGLAACMASPDLPPADRQARGEVPRLVPISGLLAQSSAQGDAPETEFAASPAARAERLRARAAQLRGPVIASGDRARLLASDSRLR